MARWRLLNAHYLNVPGTEWEYKETDRTSGKQGRKVFSVPAFLDPRDGADCNYPGEIIVSDGNGAHSRDIIFVGPPTPDMEPLDESAEAISASHAAAWVHPIETLSGQYGDQLLAVFQKQIAELASGQKAAAVSTKGIPAGEFEALKAQVAALVAENAKLKAEAPEPMVRRV